MNDTIKQYDTLLANYGDDPTVRYEVARAYVELSHIRSHRFTSQSTESMLRKSTAILDELLANDRGIDIVECRILLARSLMVLASQHSRDPKDALRAAEVAERLVRESATDRHRYLYSAAQIFLSETLHDRGELGRSAQSLKKAIGTLQELTSQVPDKPEYRGLLAYAQSHLGRALRKSSHQLDEAEALFKEAHNNYRLIEDWVNSSSRYQMARAQNRVNMADLLYRRGRTGDARAVYSDAVANLEDLTQRYPDSEWAQMMLRQARLGLTNASQGLDKVQ